MIIEALKAFLIGIVEGITEWLPISSTGHMILVDEFVKLQVSDEFLALFLVVIQLGAIMAVLILYFHKLNPFSPKKDAVEKKSTWRLWGMVAIGCIPAAVIGLLFDDLVNEYFYNKVTVAAMLILYGVFFVRMESTVGKRRPQVRRIGQINYRMALFIGLFQFLALVPGPSRSGATILGAMLIGCSRTVAAEFTFFLAVPTMAGASLVKVVKFLADGGGFSGSEVGILLTGCAVAFAVSMLCIRFLMNYVKKHDFKVFGWYRIGLGALVLAYFYLLKPAL